MPRRRRGRGRRPRTTERREGDGSPQAEARPALSVVTREEAAEPQQQAPRRVSSPTGAAAKTASRHISRDYSYVPGELKRIAITVGIIVAGIIAAAIVLR